MARPPRLQIPGAWYHLVMRGIERSDVFNGKRDREHFLELLEELSERFACNISAYVLMRNYVHLFLQPLVPNLSRAARWLLIRVRIPGQFSDSDPDFKSDSFPEAE